MCPVGRPLEDILIEHYISIQAPLAELFFCVLFGCVGVVVGRQFVDMNLSGGVFVVVSVERAVLCLCEELF